MSTSGLPLLESDFTRFRFFPFITCDAQTLCSVAYHGEALKVVVLSTIALLADGLLADEPFSRHREGFLTIFPFFSASALAPTFVLPPHPLIPRLSRVSH